MARNEKDTAAMPIDLAEAPTGSPDTTPIDPLILD